MNRRCALAPLLFTLGLLAACGPSPVEVEGPDAGSVEPPVPAVTAISPEPGPFNGEVEVTLTTDKPATIFLTSDGSDPKVEGGTRRTAEGKLTLVLTETTTLTFFSRTTEGAEETVQTARFVRAGAAKGTVSGVVIVNTLALGHEAAIVAGNAQHAIGSSATAAELPFTITGLENGRHRLRAVSDQNDDGRFVPLLELTSQAVDVELDFSDPYRASVEGLRLHLGAPGTGLCAMQGTIRHPRPANGETIRVSAVDPSAFNGGGGGDPAALLGQLQQGFLIAVNEGETEYRYLLNDLEPGTYIPVPLLTTIGAGGLSLNLQANPLQTFQCAADKVVKADLEMGPVVLNGSVTLVPQTPPTGFTWGVVAAKNVSLTRGLQAVLMPALFAPGANGELTSGFGGRGLRGSSVFGVRAFSSLDNNGGTGAGNPLLDALMWSVTPFGAAPPHATLNTGTADETLELSVPLP